MPTTVDFYLDPGCPWTWLTSRWLVDVAEERDLQVRWRPFSLALLNAGRPVPPHLDTPAFRARSETAGRALRVITALARAGDDEAAGRFYAAFGRLFHDGDAAADEDAVVAAAAAVGIDPTVLDAAGSDDVGSAIASGLEEALALAGPDVGSPVLRIDGAARGFHGPIMSPRITGEAGARLFDAIAVLQAEPALFEVKRGRSTPPAVGGAR